MNHLVKLAALAFVSVLASSSASALTLDAVQMGAYMEPSNAARNQQAGTEFTISGRGEVLGMDFYNFDGTYRPLKLSSLSVSKDFSGQFVYTAKLRLIGTAKTATIFGFAENALSKQWETLSR